MWKKGISSLRLKVLGKPYMLARIVLIIDITKKIGARMEGSRIPSPPEERFSDAIDQAYCGKESMRSRSCKKSFIEVVSNVVNLEV